MKKLDLLLEIREHFIAKFCNGNLQSVLTEEKWRELVIACICSNVSEDQIKKMKDLGFTDEEICDRLKVGKDCGICLKED